MRYRSSYEHPNQTYGINCKKSDSHKKQTRKMFASRQPLLQQDSLQRVVESGSAAVLLVFTPTGSAGTPSTCEPMSLP